VRQEGRAKYILSCYLLVCVVTVFGLFEDADSISDYMTMMIQEVYFIAGVRTEKRTSSL